jgi:ADP-ribosylglycohydrolase
MCADYPYVEPSDLAQIRAERKAGMYKPRISYSLEKRKNHMHGAWLGRCAGCLLGKPLEGTLRTRLVKFLGDLHLKEISDYVWLLPGLTEEIGVGLNRWNSGSPWGFRDTKMYMGDDDTNYTVMEMAMVKRNGIHFSSENGADFLLQNMPALATCTAERVAYKNLLDNLEPPDTAVVRNPYREWIGAQIRADFFGYVALGNPELAAELAWRDARISHVKNGIYGEMWVASMIASAIGETDVRCLIEKGLEQIPVKSRFFEAISEVLKRHANGATYDDMVRYIHERWDENNIHHWCHVISNAQIVAIGLLYGDGDFGKSITRAVGVCLDTDCNGATVGSIMGMMLGTKAISEKWTSVMNNRIHTDVTGYEETTISKLAKEMFDVHEKAQKEGKL